MFERKLRIAGVVAALGAVTVLGATTFASGPAITDAGPANTKTAGITLPDKLSPQCVAFRNVSPPKLSQLLGK